jgi:hypothetical protein
MPKGVYERPSSVRPGERYGRWTVIERTQGGSHPRYVCRCECGEEREVFALNLKNGQSTNCGCEGRRRQAAAVTRHGGTGSPEHRTWIAIHQRCTNTSDPAWHRYGGRGISVDPRWNDFATFFANMGLRPGPGYSIERRDNDGNYTPENCHWATRLEQARNRSTSRRISYNGETKTVAEWAESTGINVETLRGRLRRGVAFWDAIKPPPR